MAKTKGKIIYSDAFDFNGSFGSSGESNLGKSEEHSHGISLRQSTDGTYPFFGIYTSKPINLSEREASSLEKISFLKSF